MSTITKERVTNLLQFNSEGSDCQANAEQWEVHELARIALASLEAEPVAYVDPFAFHNFSVYRAGETDNKRMGREWMWANPDAGLIPVYTAPPAPVSVPDDVSGPLAHAYKELTPTFMRNHIDVFERYGIYPDGSAGIQAMRIALDGMSRRAAMLQGAEPVTTDYKLRDAVEIIRNSGIEIDAEKIFAERDALNTPDCWCRTCRPVTVTDMRFVVCPDCGNKRCPHANDHRNACTGSNEPGQEGSAYPAAPQQEDTQALAKGMERYGDAMQELAQREMK